MRINSQPYIFAGATIGIGLYLSASNVIGRPADIVGFTIFVAFLISFYRDRKGL